MRPGGLECGREFRNEARRPWNEAGSLGMRPGGLGMRQGVYRNETNLERTDDSFLVHPLHVACVVVLGKFLKRSKSVPSNLRGEQQYGFF